MQFTKYLEGQFDALIKSIWWIVDEKLGRMAHPAIRGNRNIITNTFDCLEHLWDTVTIRLTLAVVAPYVLHYLHYIGSPSGLAIRLLIFGLVWPWVYRIVIYNPFLDPLRHLPGPKGHWFFGHGLGIPHEDWGYFQLGYAKTLTAESAPVGLFSYTTLGCRRTVPVSPKAISYFTSSRNYVKAELRRGILRRITGEGVLVVEGNEHRRQRKILTPAFAAHHIKHLVNAFWLKACELKALWEKEALDNDKGYEVSVPLNKATLDIIGLTGGLDLSPLMVGFGYDIGALKDSANPLARAYFAIFHNSPETLLASLFLVLFPILEWLPLSYIKRSHDAKVDIERIASSIIASRLSKGDHDDSDIVGCMLNENKRLESLGDEALSNQEVLFTVLTILGAGHETTSTALVWALYNLSQHPDVQIRLREEIHHHLGKSFDPNNPSTANEILKLKYLDNVCREVLRINPPAPLTVRQAIADDVFEGVRIPRGALIHMPTVVSNLNPAFWGPDAEEFRPERWDNLKDVPNTSFLTFLHGLRACLGRRFAETEMKVVLAVLVGSFEFGKVQGWEMEKYSLITLRPKHGLYLHIKKVE